MTTIFSLSGTPHGPSPKDWDVSGRPSTPPPLFRPFRSHRFGTFVQKECQVVRRLKS